MTDPSAPETGGAADATGDALADEDPVAGDATAADARSGMTVLVVDNYDSFAYNLVQYVGEVVTTADWLSEVGDGEVVVRRNDAVDVAGVRELDPDAIVVSPGPGTPQEAGVSIPIFRELTYPTLGVCLGHQALCAVAGAPVGHAEAVVHGKPSTVSHDGRGVFRALPERFEVGRYHSLAVERADLPAALAESASTDDEAEVVMGVRHRRRPHAGVQFHPESILTEHGKQMIETFCRLALEGVAVSDDGDGVDGDDTDDDRAGDDTGDLTYHVSGELVPAEEATVSVRDRGFMYGDGAFETLRVYGGEPFEWAAHRDRLRRTAETLGFGDAVPTDLRERVAETLAANDLDDAYCKVSVTRGVQPGKLTPDPEVDPTVVVYVAPLGRGGVDGESVWDGPAAVQTVRTRRPPADALPADAKTHNYLPGVLARLELRRAATDAFAADEAVMRTTDDYLAEGATSNLFFVDDGRLKTPATDLPILPGVTRSVVVDLAESEGFSVRTSRYTLDDLRDADEVFLTNSTWEIRPVTSVDGIEVGVGPMTKLLARLFDERVEREHYGEAADDGDSERGAGDGTDGT